MKHSARVHAGVLLQRRCRARTPAVRGFGARKRDKLAAFANAPCPFVISWIEGLAEADARRRDVAPALFAVRHPHERLDLLIELEAKTRGAALARLEDLRVKAGDGHFVAGMERLVLAAEQIVRARGEISATLRHEQL